MNRIQKGFLAVGLAASALAGPLHAAEAAPVPVHKASPIDNGKALERACQGRSGWDQPAPPAQIYGNTWYVGTCGISAILITDKDGLVLIDGGVAKAAPLVLANIRKAGFSPKDVRWIVSSHEHFDHAGALAALVKATGAQVAALAPAARVLESGQPDGSDPQFGSLKGFEPVDVDRILADGDTVTVGAISLAAWSTPAHSPGSTSWTWQSCNSAGSCRTMTYADSATVISAEGYSFLDHDARVAQVREGLRKMATLPCAVLMTPHPEASNLFARLAGDAPLDDPGACHAYAEAASARFEARLEQERKNRIMAKDSAK